MVEDARQIAGLVPRVPVRQWTLQLPRAGASLAGAPADVVAAVVRAFVGAVFVAYRRTTTAKPGEPLRCGAVSVARRCGLDLRAALSVQMVVLDGVYIDPGGAPLPCFVAHPSPPPARTVVTETRCRLRKAWAQGQIRVVHRPVRGPPIVRRRFEGEQPGADGRLACTEAGVTVVGEASVAASRREDVLALAHRISAPVADPRRWLAVDGGRVRFRLPYALADGTQTVELSPEAVATALDPAVSSPRRVRFHGILAAGRDCRDRVLPAQLGLAGEPTRVVSPRPPGRCVAFSAGRRLNTGS